MKHKRYTAAAVLASAALVLAGCSSATTASSSSDSGSAGAAEGSYVFLPKSLNNPYWVGRAQGHGGGGREARRHR